MASRKCCELNEEWGKVMEDYTGYKEEFLKRGVWKRIE